MIYFQHDVSFRLENDLLMIYNIIFFVQEKFCILAHFEFLLKFNIN